MSDKSNLYIRPRSLVLPRLASQIWSEWQALGRLGAPIVVAQYAQIGNGLIDTIMAGRASTIDLAGVSIGTSIWLPILLFFMGVLSAVQPTISELRGKGAWHRIIPQTWQGIYISILGMLLMTLVLLNLQPFLHLLKMDRETEQITQGYLTAFSWGIPALLLLIALRGLTDGLGHTRVFMTFSVLAILLNIPFNVVFIYGLSWGVIQIPALGGIGCGWATSLANWIALLSLCLFLNIHRTYQKINLVKEWIAPNFQDIKALLHLGLPIGLTIFAEVSMFCMIALFLAQLGSTVVAGHQIVLSVTSVAFMLPLSLGMALTLRISYLVGAQELSQAKLLARSSALLALGVGCLNFLVLIFGGGWLASLYTTDAAVIAVATQLFTLAALFQVADVTQVTMINIQRGYKDTKIPMFIMLGSFWGICLPLGYSLTFTDWLIAPLGAAGFWTALILGLSCAAVLLTWRVWRFTPKVP